MYPICSQEIIIKQSVNPPQKVNRNKQKKKKKY